MNDASLSRLHDVVEPAAVGWLPLAPGWVVLLVSLAALLLFALIRGIRRYRLNAYRRDALRELAGLERTDQWQRISEVLKRTAVAAWPRQQVAALDGPDWHRFLDESCGQALFCGELGTAMDRLAYQAVNSHAGVGPQQLEQLIQAARTWISKHRVPEA